MRNTRTMTATLVSVAMLGAVAAGCSAKVEVDPGDTAQKVAKEEVERSAKENLEKSVGQQADSVECEGGLQAEVGQSVRCVLTAGATRIGLTASVKSVEGDDIRMNFQVDDQPMP